MTRDVAALSAKTVDVLVVGGGIYGLTIACDAAQRGLTVALIERDDFGSGSSFNHLRTIHGGLRYLQRLDIARSRESIRERRTLARIAPQTLRPLPFALPLYRSIKRGPLAMRAGLLLDRLVSLDRNQLIPSSHQLPAGRVVSRSEAIERFPGLERSDLAGAAIWYDYVTIEADRLTLSWALAAANHGAVLANYVEAMAPLVDGRRVAGIRAIDRVTGSTLDIGARLTVNATGAAVDRLLTPLGLSARLPLLKAMNLVTTRGAGDEALGGLSMSGRPLFLVPWRGRAVFGTWESGRPVAPAETGVDGGEIADFIDDLNQAFPALDLKATDVSLVHRGLVPAASKRDGSVALEGHEQTRDHAADGVEGLMSVAGTKYTTARAVAERMTDKVLAKLGCEPRPCRTAVTPLPGGDLRDVPRAIDEAHREYDARLPGDTIAHLIAAYGSRFRDVLQASAGQPASLMRLSQSSPVIGAELIWAARREMAVTLRDAVIRRTPLGALGHPGDPAALCAAAIMAPEHGWSPEQTAAELSSLRSFYQS
jgi:glycerol-3-phosphate dehydrogenase